MTMKIIVSCRPRLYNSSFMMVEMRSNVRASAGWWNNGALSREIMFSTNYEDLWPFLSTDIMVSLVQHSIILFWLFSSSYGKMHLYGPLKRHFFLDIAIQTCPSSPKAIRQPLIKKKTPTPAPPSIISVQPLTKTIICEDERSNWRKSLMMPHVVFEINKTCKRISK